MSIKKQEDARMGKWASSLGDNSKNHFHKQLVELRTLHAEKLVGSWELFHYPVIRQYDKIINPAYTDDFIRLTQFYSDLIQTIGFIEFIQCYLKSVQFFIFPQIDVN